jgi:hypothetical protein
MKMSRGKTPAVENAVEHDLHFSPGGPGGFALWSALQDRVLR